MSGLTNRPSLASEKTDAPAHIAPATDEIGVSVGPDADAGGLFDLPAEATATGEPTGEATGADPTGASLGQRRTAALAWIAAPVDDGPPAPESGPPCAAVKRAIADEPLDPLPALDGVAWRTAPDKSPAITTPAPAPLARRPERENTATQIDPFRPTVTTIERRITPMWVWPLVFASIGAVAWAFSK